MLDTGFTPLTAITCVLSAKAPTVAALLHITELLDATLDPTTVISLRTAVTTNSLRLVDRVLKRVRGGLALPPPDRFHTEIALGEAIKAAVEHGRLDFVQRIHDVHPQPLSSRLLRIAARRGDRSMLEWLLTHRTDGLCIPHPMRDTDIPRGQLNCCIREAYFEALNHTQLHIVRWLFERGFINSMESAGDVAAAAGDLEMVQWVHAQNCVHTFSSAALDKAASGGHLAVVEFLVTNRSEQCTYVGLIAAKYANHDTIVSLLQAKNAVGGKQDPVAEIVYAAAHGRLDVLEAYHRENRERVYFQSAFYAAVEYGQLAVIDWLVTTVGLRYTASARCNAAVHGHLSLIQWSHAKDHDGWAVDVMNAAAVHGQLQVVQWLHQNRSEGCTTAAMNGAATNGHLEMVQWLHTNRTEGCTTEAMNGAACCGHLRIVQWLHENRSEGCTTTAMDEAASSGQLEVVKWLHCHRIEGCTTRAMDGAARGGFLPVLQFLHKYRNEGCSWQAAVMAAIHCHTHAVNWLRENYPLVYDPERVADATGRIM